MTFKLTQFKHCHFLKSLLDSKVCIPTRVARINQAATVIPLGVNTCTNLLVFHNSNQSFIGENTGTGKHLRYGATCAGLNDLVCINGNELLGMQWVILYILHTTTTLCVIRETY